MSINAYHYIAIDWLKCLPKVKQGMSYWGFWVSINCY